MRFVTQRVGARPRRANLDPTEVNDLLATTYVASVTANTARELGERYLQAAIDLVGGAAGPGFVWIGGGQRTELGIIAGDCPPAIIGDLRERTAATSRPEIVREPDGSTWCAAPVFGIESGLVVWGVIGFPVAAGAALDQSQTTVLNAYGLQLGSAHLARIESVELAELTAKRAAAAARIAVRLTEPTPCVEALSIVVETLRDCFDSIAAIEFEIDGPRCVAATNILPDDYALDLARSLDDGLDPFTSEDGKLVLPIGRDSECRALIVLETARGVTQFERDVLSGIASVVANSAARHLAEVEIARLGRVATTSLIDGQERERSRIAADIHDTVLQQIAAAAVRLELVAADLATNSIGDSAGKIAVEVQRLRDASHETRAVLADLWSDELSRGDFGAAISDLAARAPELDVSLRFEVDRDLDPRVATAAYRIVQEALRNVVKHALATEATIEIDLIDDSLVVKISDNGAGFNTLALDSRQNGRHFGVIGMRERAAMLGGTFVIESAADSGTKVRVALPTEK